MKYSKLTDTQVQLLENMIVQGYVRYTKHNSLPLTIYKYTNKCVYDGVWNDVTIMCKGLVLDESYTIVSRSFDKFFETPLDNLQKLNYNDGIRFYEKIDGCQIKMTYYKNHKLITSTGNFTSDVVNHAWELLGSVHFPPYQDRTYIFEMCHPEHRIVLDYGDNPVIYYLGYVLHNTGKFKYDHNDQVQSVPYCVFHSYNEFLDHYDLQEDVKEGFVFMNEGVMYKIKNETYKMKHKLKSHYHLLQDDKYLLRQVNSITKNMTINDVVQSDFSSRVVRLMVNDLFLDGIFDDLLVKMNVIRKNIIDEYNKQLMIMFDNYEDDLNTFMRNHTDKSSIQAELHKFDKTHKNGDTILKCLLKILLQRKDE